MPDSVCTSCRKPQKPSDSAKCSLCEGALCKSCIKHHDPESLSFLKEIPSTLAHLRYCGSCYDEQVAPAVDSYEEVMAKAKQVFVFFKTQRKSIPLTGRSKLLFKVTDRPDRDETIMRLAFFAAEQGFNALIEVDLLCEKIRNGAYQKSKWSGTGIPAQVDETRLDRDEALEKRFK